MTRVRMLAAVMRRAHDRGYCGPGDLWPYACDEHLEEVLAEGRQNAVIRSARFCMRYWAKLRILQVSGLPAIEGRLEDLAWEAHQQLLEKHPDPLSYAYEHLNDEP